MPGFPEKSQLPMHPSDDELQLKYTRPKADRVVDVLQVARQIASAIHCYHYVVIPVNKKSICTAGYRAG
jgi:hypothetical protein